MAGGQSQRFGGFPKGLAIVEEERIADRAIAALRGATDDILIIANDPRAATWFPGHTILADAEAGLGPLAGIETALRGANGAPIIVVAWDMPFVETPLLRGMRALCEIGADAVVPEHGNPPVIEPLCACYAASALPVATRLLAAGERRAAALIENLDTVVRVPERVLVEHGDPEKFFASVDDLEQLIALGGELPRR
jgi:molybdopterin-guanine dinucleotide biosynthesis protein A